VEPLTPGSIEFADYDRFAICTDLMINRPSLERLQYYTLGLNGEAGEVADKVKKVVRDQHSTFTTDSKEDLLLELGDVLWYISRLAKLCGSTLADVAEANRAKLFARKQQGTLTGSGDNR
jgi:NTP pyrophosphatase (non-canonical NTP hydrolase)